MTDTASIDRFVQRIRDAYDAVFAAERAERGYGCPFHLSRCWCSAPSPAQPCWICGYYPMYGLTNSSLPKNGCTRERFISVAERNGGIAVWYFASFRRVLAYQPGTTFQAKIDGLVEDAKTWEGVPSPAKVWDVLHAAERA